MMGSRTTMKQQMMRQKVMNEEKPQKDSVNMTNVTYNNNMYKCVFNNSPNNNECLPSLTSTIVGSTMHFDYCKPILNDTNDINFNYDRNSIDEDFPTLNFDYNESLSKIDSPYLLQNVYSTDNKYNLQPFSDFNHQSPSIENHIDSNGYNNQYHNLNNKSRHVGQMQQLYGCETSFSCPVTIDQSTSSYNQRQMINSNSAVVGGISLNYEEKRSQIKDRSKKESHNRIERKRRDFINQQIIELGNLLPPLMMTEGESKKNKGNILKNSVVYIQHLQNELGNTSNFIKETDMAHTLIDNYHKQIQELQQQLTTLCSQNMSSLPDHQINNDNYTQYLMLHELNRRTVQSINQLSLPLNNSLYSDIHSRYSVSSYNKSPVSTLDNGSPFKVEPSSEYSSLGNTSLNATYRINEERRVDVTSLNDMLCPPVSGQFYQKCPVAKSDYFFNSRNNYKELVKQRFESMEC